MNKDGKISQRPIRSQLFLTPPPSEEGEAQHMFSSIIVFMAFPAKHFPFGDDADMVTRALLS